MSHFAVTEQLVRLLRFDHDPASSQAKISADTWDDLAIAAIALGLAPLLHTHAQSLNLPPAARARLAVTYAATQRRNQAIAGQLAELLAAYAAANIDVIVLKGGYLAFQVYPDPALRGMSDLDLLFRSDELGRAEAVLQGLGYQGKHKPAEEGPGIVKHTSTYQRGNSSAGSTPNPYLSTVSDRHVDPHGTLEEVWFGLRVDITPGVWERSRPVTLVGQPALALAREDLLLHLAVHLIFHLLMSKPSLVQLYDLALLCQAQELNWDVLIARSRQSQAGPFLYAALHLAQTAFAAPVPAPIMEEMHQACPRGLARTIAGLTIHDVMRQTQRPPLTSIRQRLVRGILDRRDAARWATTWQGKWAVWRTAIDVGRTDTGKLIGQRLRARLSRS